MSRCVLVIFALMLAGCYDLSRLRPVEDAAMTTDAGSGPDLAGPLSRCPALAAQLCDGFEGDAVDASRWNEIQYNATLSIDDTRAYRGLRSLRADGLAAASGVVQAEITESATFPSSDIFMRAFVYIPSSTPATTMRLMTPYETDPPYSGVALLAKPTSTGFAPQIFNGIDGTTTNTAMAGFATDRWVCLEWEVTLGAPGAVHVWVDDVAYPDLSITTNTSTTPPFGVLSFGLEHPAGAPAHSIWLDEVVVDTQRITCAR